MESKYDTEVVKNKLARHGIRTSRNKKEIDASFARVLGIKLLGMLDFMHSMGYSILMPEWKKQGYRGLARP